MMSLLELISRALPLANINNTGKYLFAKCLDDNDNEDFWTRELDDKTMKDIVERMYDLAYGIRHAHVLYNSTNTARQRSLELEGWQQLPSIFNTVPFDDLMEILKDSLDMGFDVKIVDSVIYYREKAKEEHSFSQHVVR